MGVCVGVCVCGGGMCVCVCVGGACVCVGVCVCEGETHITMNVDKKLNRMFEDTA